mgnify:CR=1 FL=1
MPKLVEFLWIGGGGLSPPHERAGGGGQTLMSKYRYFHTYQGVRSWLNLPGPDPGLEENKYWWNARIWRTFSFITQSWLWFREIFKYILPLKRRIRIHAVWKSHFIVENFKQTRRLDFIGGGGGCETKWGGGGNLKDVPRFALKIFGLARP